MVDSETERNEREIVVKASALGLRGTYPEQFDFKLIGFNDEGAVYQALVETADREQIPIDLVILDD